VLRGGAAASKLTPAVCGHCFLLPDTVPLFQNSSVFDWVRPSRDPSCDSAINLAQGRIAMQTGHQLNFHHNFSEPQRLGNSNLFYDPVTTDRLLTELFREKEDRCEAHTKTSAARC
jgi:hypothetical protein